MVVTIVRYKDLYNQYFSPALDASSVNMLKKKKKKKQFYRKLLNF